MRPPTHCSRSCISSYFATCTKCVTFLLCIYMSEDWFSVDEKEPVAHAKVEVIEASDLKPSDPNGWCSYCFRHLFHYIMLYMSSK